MGNNSPRPGVVVASKFIFSTNDAFSKYVEYIDREEAIRNEEFSEYDAFHQAKGRIQTDGFAQNFGNYNDYMANPEKTSALFTSDYDQLDDEQKTSLKKAFQMAQKNKSLMWQHVVSFDNDFLVENGLYDPATHSLNEHALRRYIRDGMAALIHSENMENAAIWSAAIHYNTDNIHIHIAMTEPVPTRRKKVINGVEQPVGRLKQSSLDKLKSSVANGIIQSKEHNVEITRIMRQNILAAREEHPIMRDRRFQALFLQVYASLPADKRYWRYGMNALKEQRPSIDKLASLYLETYHPADFKELKQKLANMDEKYKRAYGGQRQPYSIGKIQDLYTRLGNTILNEMKEYDRAMKYESFKRKQGWSINQQTASRSLNHALFNLAALSSDDYDHWKNQIIYERAVIEQELER